MCALNLAPKNEQNSCFDMNVSSSEKENSQTLLASLFLLHKWDKCGGELQTEGAAPPGKQSSHSTHILFHVPQKNNSMFVFSFQTTEHLSDDV